MGDLKNSIAALKKIEKIFLEYSDFEPQWLKEEEAEEWLKCFDKLLNSIKFVTYSVADASVNEGQSFQEDIDLIDEKLANVKEEVKNYKEEINKLQSEYDDLNLERDELTQTLDLMRKYLDQREKLQRLKAEIAEKEDKAVENKKYYQIFRPLINSYQDNVLELEIIGENLDNKMEEIDKTFVEAKNILKESIEEKEAKNEEIKKKVN